MSGNFFDPALPGNLPKSVRKPAKAVKPPVENTGRPIIRVLSGLRHIAASEGMAVIEAAGVPFYQRDRGLVRCAIAKAKTADGEIIEIPNIVPVTAPMLGRVLGMKAEWERVNKDGEATRIDPPKEVVEQIAAMSGEWPFPPLTGLISTQTMRRDGSILDHAGYDDATGLLLVCPPSMEPIPDSPSDSDIDAAQALLMSLLAEFPFADEASRSVALSMILTTILRGALLPAVPMHVATAPDAGTGKSYLLDTAAMIATGERCPVIAVSPDQNETEKRLTAAALSGQQIIALDNCSEVLFGDFLNQVTERPLLQLRRLGGSDLVRIPNTFSVFANGNNLSAPADLVRRTLVCSLDANLENPAARVFQRNPVKDVMRNRGRYVAAALTIGRAYVVAGYPGQLPTLASFEPWSDLVRSAIVWLGMTDPCETQDLARAEDPIRAAKTAVFKAWTDEIGLNPGGFVSNALVQMAEETDAQGFLHPRFREACLAIAGDRSGVSISAKRLGKWLNSVKNNRVADLKLTVNLNDVTRPRWVLGRG